MSVVCCPLSGGEANSDTIAHCLLVAAERIECYECSDGIAAGDTYEWFEVQHEDDDEVSTYTTCLSCVEIRDHFECEGWTFGQLWEDLHENFIPDMKAGGPCLEGLSPAAKQRLFDTRMEWLETDDGRDWLAEHAARPQGALT